jgi:3-hydroxybutyryl-CoA dehydrogenase
MKTIQSAAVIGTGMMGPGIAVVLSLGGVRPTIVSRNAEGAQRAANRALQISFELAENGLIGGQGAASVNSSDDLDAAVREADIVIESVPEDLALKQELFAHLDRIARPEAILASNTSSLSITSIAEKCSRPERVLTTHFWNPPHLMRLVEIVKGSRTSQQSAETVRDLLAKCGKLPVIVKKDTPGQLGNRLQFALLREAMHIVQEGIADVADVDAVVKNGFGVRMPVYGLFEHQDVVGLKTCKAVMEYVAPNLNSEPRAPRLIDEMLAQKRGFYPPGKLDHDAVRARRDRFVLEFLKSQRSESAKGGS